MRSEIDQLKESIKKLEKKFQALNLQKAFAKFFRNRSKADRQRDAYRGVNLALCIDTRDPLKKHRVRFYSPILHQPETEVSQLDWAWPNSAMGGFDDMGLSWVPPAGSTLCLLFQNASPDQAIYIGTTWQGNRGVVDSQEVNYRWGYEIPEYRKLYKGHRGGYMVGPDDESQVFPHDNTNNYQGFDVNEEEDTENLANAGVSTTWPHRFSVSSAEKHRIILDDGDPKCNRRWKKMQLLSSTGISMTFKDDVYHPCGEEMNPKCSEADAEPYECHKELDEEGNPILIPVTDIEGNQIYDEYGNPVFVDKWDCQQGPEDCPRVELDDQYIELGGLVTNASGSTPIVITTNVAHNLADNFRVDIDGVLGNTAANGYFRIIVLSPTTFAIYDTDGNPIGPDGTYDKGGNWLVRASEEYTGDEANCPAKEPPADSNNDDDPCSTIYKNWYDQCNFNFKYKGKNIYQKHRQECYPYNCGCSLPQSGVELISRSTAKFVMDDSVEEPKGTMGWERSLSPFDFDGCTGKFMGRTFWQSATKHVIELNDMESHQKVRGPRNGVNIMSASGNKVILSDHTNPCCVAGDYRGVHIGSTSNHTIDMCDAGNLQCSPERGGCAKPASRADKGFFRLRSGSGIEIMMNDAYSQTKTDQQYLQLKVPQKDNLKRGPHLFHMQSNIEKGQIFLRAGGDYIVQCYDNMVEVVGEDKNPSDKFEYISRKKIVQSKDMYYNKAKNHVFWADENILLLAGKDCQKVEDNGTAEGGEIIQGPCIFPVLVACQPIPEYITKEFGIKASDRVFASAQECVPCTQTIIGT